MSNGVVSEQWYSVKQAAGYIGVSQPTIFRWMKDGILSFYKVGGSTRFTLDNLNAVIEKSTGSKEAEAVQGKCAVCGHGVLVQGRMQSTGVLYFKPDKTRFWVLEEALVPLNVRTCSACGFIHMFADTAKMARLQTKQKDAEEATDETAGE